MRIQTTSGGGSTRTGLNAHLLDAHYVWTLANQLQCEINAH